MAENTAPATPSASPKKSKPSRPNIFARFGKYLKDTKSEVKKVVWPTKSQIINNSLVVIVMIVLVGAFIALIDAIFTYGLGLLLGLAV
ncbi:MAG TPA: preprotein translocase subunit SecE [Terriglobales bacterium]|nr:preprotein translocase subunit SecE [Terriglobales bacterium]